MAEFNQDDAVERDMGHGPTALLTGFVPFVLTPHEYGTGVQNRGLAFHQDWNAAATRFASCQSTMG